MNTTMNSAAPSHLPFWLPGPDGSDPVLAGTGIALAAAVLAFGLLMLRIHMLPDHIADRGHKVQLEIVAVLGLLSMVSGIHGFWVAALLLALIDIPDFTGPLRRIAGSTERIAWLGPGAGDASADLPPTRNAADRYHPATEISVEGAPTRHPAGERHDV